MTNLTEMHASSEGAESDEIKRPADPKDLAAKLVTSPIFALTSAAKETSHTNFLAFLLQADRRELDPIRRELGRCFEIDNLATDTGGEVYVWREKYNFDLLIVVVTAQNPVQTRKSKAARWQASKAILVEAKLKSVPTQEQLDRYTEKSNGKLILDLPRMRGPSGSEKRGDLSDQVEIDPSTVKRVLLANSPDIFSGWDVVRWPKIVDALDNGMAAMAGPDADHLRYMLKDYRDGLAAMLHLVEAEQAIANDPELSWGDKLKRWETYKELKLHDLVSKYSVSSLLPKMAADAFHQLPSIKGLERDARVIYHNGTVGVHLEISVPLLTTDFSKNSTPRSRLCIGVQIEGDDYRHFLILRDGTAGCSARFRNFLEECHQTWFMQNGLTGRKRYRGGDAFESLKTYSIAREIMKYSSRSVADSKFSQILDDLKISFQAASRLLRSAASTPAPARCELRHADSIPNTSAIVA